MEISAETEYILLFPNLAYIIFYSEDALFKMILFWVCVTQVTVARLVVNDYLLHIVMLANSANCGPE